MKVLLVNGSPKRAAAASRLVLDSIEAKLGPERECRMIEVAIQREARPEALEAELLVLAFPLYVDSLPAPVLAWLVSLEKLRSQSAARESLPPQAMVAAVNCGFYEGVQNKSALEIVANFCARAGIEWRGGLGIGSGGMMKGIENAPEDMFIKRPVSRAIAELAKLALEPRHAEAWRHAEDAQNGAGKSDARLIYASYAFPRLLYIAAAHAEWRKAAAANGLNARDLGAQPYLSAQLSH